MTKMSPRVRSEVSGRLTGLDPVVRQFFSQSEIVMTGKDMEEFACSVWLIGYGNALADITELPGELPDLTPIVEMWGWDDR